MWNKGCSRDMHCCFGDCIHARSRFWIPLTEFSMCRILRYQTVPSIKYHAPTKMVRHIKSRIATDHSSPKEFIPHFGWKPDKGQTFDHEPLRLLAFRNLDRFSFRIIIFCCPSKFLPNTPLPFPNRTHILRNQRPIPATTGERYSKNRIDIATQLAGQELPK